MKTGSLIVLWHCLFVLFFCSCTKEQYRGHHLAVSKQEELKDEHNNFHVKETQEVLNKNVKRKDKREKRAEKNRLALLKENTKTNNKCKKKKSLDFDFY